MGPRIIGNLDQYPHSLRPNVRAILGLYWGYIGIMEKIPKLALRVQGLKE